MHIIRHAPIAFSLVLLAACAGTHPVPVTGSRADLDELAGDWAGEYSSAETGRSGRISFTLSASADTAHGAVRMVPRGSTRALEPTRTGQMDRHYELYDVLHVDFVQVSDGTILGKLAPYRDPVCGCELHTTFQGRLGGDRIEGTFHTRGAQGGHEANGEWWATRG